MQGPARPAPRAQGSPRLVLPRRPHDQGGTPKAQRPLRLSPLRVRLRLLNPRCTMAAGHDRGGPSNTREDPSMTDNDIVTLAFRVVVRCTHVHSSAALLPARPSHSRAARLGRPHGAEATRRPMQTTPRLVRPHRNSRTQHDCGTGRGTCRVSPMSCIGRLSAVGSFAARERATTWRDRRPDRSLLRPHVRPTDATSSQLMTSPLSRSRQSTTSPRSTSRSIDGLAISIDDATSLDDRRTDTTLGTRTPGGSGVRIAGAGLGGQRRGGTAQNRT